MIADEPEPEVVLLQSLLVPLLTCMCLVQDAASDGADPTLRGSPASMEEQHEVATEAGYTFVETPAAVDSLAATGTLVPVPGGAKYEVMDWVVPYALPGVRQFVERFAHRYSEACGEQLVVTSLLRPESEQPPNAHELSVHPAGMAVDLRVSETVACREFLEEALLEHEAAGRVEVTRERAPPHYHVAVYPQPYTAWAATQPPLPAEPAELPQTRIEDAEPRSLWLLLVVLLPAMALAWLIIRRR